MGCNGCVLFTGWFNAIYIYFFFSTGPPQQLQSTQKSILGFERWQKDILDLDCAFYFSWTDQLKTARTWSFAGRPRAATRNVASSRATAPWLSARAWFRPTNRWPNLVGFVHVDDVCVSVCNEKSSLPPWSLLQPPVIMGFHGSRSVFMVFSWFKVDFSWLQVGFHGFSWFPVGYL